jgi:hypothetical protein
MDRRRQAIFLFIAAGLFAFIFVERAARHGFGGRGIVAGILAVILAVLGARTLRAPPEVRRDGDE